MRWRDLVVALSLSNLVYLRCWAEMLTLNRNEFYWLSNPPSPPHFIALIINVILLALILTGLMWALRQRHGLAFKLAPLLCLLILMSLVNSLRTLVGRPGNSLFLRFVVQRTPAFGVLIAIAILIALGFGGMRALKPVYVLLTLLSPFVAIAFAQAAYRIATFDPSITANGPLASRLPAKPPDAPRVVWVIFDEWDDGLAFKDRSPRVHLPETDRLREGSLFASKAITANTNTDWSIPSLTMGTPVEDVHPDGPSEMMLRAPGSQQWLRWSRQPNVFGKARELGFNTAVVAWALPYCRVLNSNLTDCWWWSGSNQYNSNGNTIPEILINQPRSLYENIYRSPFGQSLSTQRHRMIQEAVLARSLQVACDRSLGLTLLHFPIPHPPYFYNAATGRDDLGATPIFGILKQNQQGYLDALELMDKTIGSLRHEMEIAGVWDTTTVVMSSDHPFRHHDLLDGNPASRTVPYLIKAAGQTQPLHYDAAFSAMLTSKLILAFLSGELARAEQVPAWLDAHRSEYPGTL
jgi:Sulfatase